MLALKVGLKLANRFEVTCLLLLNRTATLPPDHGSVCVMPLLYVVVSFWTMVPLLNWLVGGCTAAQAERRRERWPVERPQPLDVVVLNERLRRSTARSRPPSARGGLVERQLHSAPA